MEVETIFNRIKEFALRGRATTSSEVALQSLHDMQIGEGSVYSRLLILIKDLEEQHAHETKNKL